MDAVTADLGGVLRGEGNGDGFLVDVQAEVMHGLLMGVWFRYLLSMTLLRAGLFTSWFGPLRRIPHVCSRNQKPALSVKR